MTTADVFGDELRGKVDALPRWEPDDHADVALAPEGQSRARQLLTIWADSIALDLGSVGLVDGLLPRIGMTVMYGESGAGKTFAAIDVACHVATGRPWRDREVETGNVIYVAAEAPESIKRRLVAWKTFHGAGSLPVLVVQSTVDLLNGDAGALAELVAATARERGRVALVVIDTLARSMTGNENAPDDMGKFVAGCAAIRAAGETHVLVVHHAGKDVARGARGHSSLRAATDVELEVAEGAVRVTKSRDDVSGGLFGFRLEPVELGTAAGGKLIWTCVAVPSDAPPRAGRQKPLGANERIVLDALRAALAELGTAAPLARDIPSGVTVVTVEQWQEAAMRYLPQPEVKRKKEAFNRALAGLVARQHVRHAGGFAWLS